MQVRIKPLICSKGIKVSVVSLENIWFKNQINNTYDGSYQENSPNLTEIVVVYCFLVHYTGFI